jgi:hypothetical protein
MLVRETLTTSDVVRETLTTSDVVREPLTIRGERKVVAVVEACTFLLRRSALRRNAIGRVCFETGES